MANNVKITSKGQITIPKKLRDEIKIKVGMYLNAYVEDGNLVLKPIPQDSDKVKLLNYAYKESQGNIGIDKVREKARDFNLNMSSQVREIREEEAVDDE